MTYRCQVRITERDEVVSVNTVQAASTQTAYTSNVQPKQKIDAQINIVNIEILLQDFIHFRRKAVNISCFWIDLCSVKVFCI